jgi:class 3 adenylate cyclase
MKSSRHFWAAAISARWSGVASACRIGLILSECAITHAPDYRQLLAIMFTDVVGYTALTERDEAAAVRVREQHRELVKTLVHQFDGEVVDATGDESLSIFPSALRAVDCALATRAMTRPSASRPAATWPP